jgi:hypothetical protein
MNIVKSYPYIAMDDDLNYCTQHQIVWQKDMSKSVEYDTDYFNKYVGYENSEIAKCLNHFRITLAHRHASSLLDIGIGSGEFIKNWDEEICGFDVNPIAIEWLTKHNIFVNPYEDIPDNIDGITMWDVIEHIPEPQLLFDKIKSRTVLMTSLPIFKDVTRVRESKHFKFDEHFYYFSKDGFIKFMTDSNFKIVDYGDWETQCGREDIMTFVFQKL